MFLGFRVRGNRGVIDKSVSAQRVDRRVDRCDSGWAPSILTSMRVTDCVYVSDGGGSELLTASMSEMARKMA